LTDFSPINRLFQIEGSCGYTEKDLAYWIEVYGGIPTVLREYYLEFGKHEALNNSHDFLIKPEQFQEYDDSDYLIFYSENQGVSVWGIKKEEVREDNPPVYENYGDAEWHLTSDSISEFLISMAHFQGLMCMAYCSEVDMDISQEQAKQIEKSFLTKHADSGLYTGTRFFGNYDDTVVMLINNAERFGLMYSSSSKGHYDEVDRIIKAILLNTENTDAGQSSI
jgi:hypothetical protein